jgi:hypothetical protein
MAKVSGDELVVRALRKVGIEKPFTLHGGRLWL